MLENIDWGNAGIFLIILVGDRFRLNNFPIFQHVCYLDAFRDIESTVVKNLMQKI